MKIAFQNHTKALKNIGRWRDILKEWQMFFEECSRREGRGGGGKSFHYSS